MLHPERRGWQRRIQKYWKEGRVHRLGQCVGPVLSRMHTANYMPFIREKATYWISSEANMGEATAHPFQYTTAQGSLTFQVKWDATQNFSPFSFFPSFCPFCSPIPTTLRSLSPLFASFWPFPSPSHRYVVMASRAESGVVSQTNTGALQIKKITNLCLNGI